ncbi:MAG: hypothetical protein AM325_006700 [Candidatus Thorarchaeota archaeon SMTZ1-45]|nr:MAG: hypothetical protein AM325_08450 [Candidatus Thorarchaeota archaeon SMTZ1-45]
MEEFDKVLQALSVVERYEEYLFRKIWGRVLIFLGIVLPLGVVVSMNAVLVAGIIGLDTELISIFANVMTLLLCFGFIAYSFFESWKTVESKSKEETTDAKHGALIGIVWFLAFTLTGLLPESLRLISLLWAAGASCLITFAILRAVGSHGKVSVLFYLGISLCLISFPLLLISDIMLLGYLTLIVFSICFIVAGIAMNRTAAHMLQSST